MVNAGSLGKHKGVELIVRMAGLLRDRGHHNFSVDLYGMGGDPSLRTMIQSDRLDMVTIRGFRSQAELYALYPQYDVFLFPTWEREPFGFAPLEAMAHGCLAIMTRVCGIAEWLMDGSECLKVARDPAALADAVEGLLSGQTPLAEVGRRGARTVQQWFTLNAVLPTIEAELQAAVEAGGGPRRSAAEAHKIALLAEKMFQAMVYESAAA
jgi:glycosyltransferase involved in cell wall biosynthesis